MKISVLSGKGGTGKTTVSTNLFSVLSDTILLDCDVEEPNAHLFFPADEKAEFPVYTRYPEIDEEKCSYCGKCARFCYFNALIVGKKQVLPLSNLCHACEGCLLVCPEEAIHYENREIGKRIELGISSGQKIIYGVLNTGEFSGVKIIENVLQSVEENQSVIIDSPPGSACAAVASVESSDYAVLVSEPTPFGVSDMKMVVDMLKGIGIPFGVVVNKAGIGDREIYEYCQSEKIEILGEIPFDRELAALYADGILVSEKNSQYRKMFTNLAEKIGRKAEKVSEYS